MKLCANFSDFKSFSVRVTRSLLPTRGGGGGADDRRASPARTLPTRQPLQPSEEGLAAAPSSSGPQAPAGEGLHLLPLLHTPRVPTPQRSEPREAGEGPQLDLE